VEAEDCHTPLSPRDRSSKRNQQRNVDINDNINQIDLTDAYRIFHLTTTKHSFFSAAHKTFAKIDHILGHKANHSKYKKTEIAPCILSDQVN
jgi:exonuclease III